MKKNNLCNFKDLEKPKKIGYISVFLLFLSFIFILLFINLNKVSASPLLEKDIPIDVIRSGLFLTADVEQTEDILLLDSNNDIDKADVLLCVNYINLTAGYYQDKVNDYGLPNNLDSYSESMNVDLSFGPFRCYNIFAYENGEDVDFRSVVLTEFRDSRKSLLGEPISYNFYLDNSEEIGFFRLGYNYQSLKSVYYDYFYQGDFENDFYDLGYNAGLDVGYDNGYLDASSDPKAITDYLRDSSLNIDLETEVNGIKNEIIGNLYYENIANFRLSVNDFNLNFSFEPILNERYYFFRLPESTSSVKLNNLSALNLAHQDMFGTSLEFTSYTYVRTGLISDNTIIYHVIGKYDNNMIVINSFNDDINWCNPDFSDWGWACSDGSNSTTQAFKNFMTKAGIDYLDFSYVLETPIITDISNLDFDFYDYDKGFENGKQVGFVNGFNDGQQDGIETMSGSWISNLFVGLGALFSIAIAPNITIGMIAMIPIVLALVPFVIGLATGKRGRD